MSRYLSWNEKTITDFSDKNINSLYHEGYVFTRLGAGVMHQTRSIRIDLSKFELSSENRRILKKTEDLRLEIENLPYKNYDWSIGKLAKDFYDKKFGKNIFSANKVKELLTMDDGNYNKLLIYTADKEIGNWKLEIEGKPIVGFCIARETNEILHYSYPFYELRTMNSELKNMGMGMMLRAIEYAKEQSKQYIYLGSFQRPTDVYKLQFAGLEWFDGEGWNKNSDELKKLLK